LIAENIPVEYCFPKTVEEAYKLKQMYGDGAHFIAGGTDLLLEKGNIRPHLLIDLTRIPALQRLEVDDKRILIGSAVTYSRLLGVNPILTRVPFLANAIRTIGGRQIRNVATLAGNLINASPAGDTLPSLYCLEAQVGIDGPLGQRCLPVHEFVLGVRRTALISSEIVTQVSFEFPGPGWYTAYEKLGLRRAMAISVANVALMLKVEDRRVVQARIALGAVAPTVIRVPEVEAYLTDHTLEENSIEEAARLAAESCIPIDDIRGSARYRKEVVCGLMRRGLHTLYRQINGQE